SVETALFADVFGMGLQMPQIAAKSGFKWFIAGRYASRGIGYLAEKLSPHIHYWKGPDGSMILGGWGVPVVWEFRPVEQLKAEGLANIKRMTALHDYVYAMPQAERVPPMEYTVSAVREWDEEEPESYRFSIPRQMFAEVETADRAGAFLPVLSGEFNPEFTGCYTSRTDVKQLNRYFENRLLSLEAAGTVLRLQGIDYPDDISYEAWRNVVFNQFHDSICGCHTEVAHKDIMQRYAVVENLTAGMEEDMIRFAGSSAGGNAETAELLVFNPLPYRRTDLCEVELVSLTGEAASVIETDGTPVPCLQEGSRLTFLCRQAPALGLKRFSISRGTSAAQPVVADNPDKAVLKNDRYRLEFRNGKGMVSLRLLANGREMLRDAGNLLLFQEDMGDPWVEEFTGLRVDAGKGRISLDRYEKNDLYEKIAYSGDLSDVIWWSKTAFSWQQEIILPREGNRIKCRTIIDWQGKAGQVQLRFPTAIKRTSALYEVPFAVVDRGAYDGLPKARGDWPFLRFFSLEDQECGLAFIGKGISGAHVIDGEMRISLMRRPFYQDEQRSEEQTSETGGTQTLDYELMVYQGNWAAGSVCRAAQCANQPVAAWPLRSIGPWLNTGRDMMLISGKVEFSCLKSAANGKGVVIRLFEVEGKGGQATIAFGGRVDEVLETDMRERTVLHRVTVAGNKFSLEFKPYEIKTVLIKGWSLQDNEPGAGREAFEHGI
ncbi:MAG: glycoside hydrolase family 38 C-terminal domain-containing protein, partial [bacterium]|nr:glycoside hydrolase family 38 C-terminal domain-containing protein [bacterium]